MTAVFDPDRHHRRSIHLPGYDYSRAGAYFVTICSQDWACLFGDIADGALRINDAGRIIEKWWIELNRKFPNVQTGEFVVMPNHFHGIIIIHDEPVGADLRVRPDNTGQSAIRGGQLQGAHMVRPYRKSFNGLKP